MNSKPVMTIKLELAINLSEDTKAFLASVLNSSQLIPFAATALTSEAKDKEESPAPAPTAPAAPAAPAAPVPSTTSITIESIREELSKKVNDFRNEIKEKLNELGAPSVTKLDKSKYQEMYNFLMAL